MSEQSRSAGRVEGSKADRYKKTTPEQSSWIAPGLIFEGSVFKNVADAYLGPLPSVWRGSISRKL